MSAQCQKKNDEIDFAIVCDRFQLEREGPTDQPTNQRTDKASYRDAWTHLKRINFKLP